MKEDGYSVVLPEKLSEENWNVYRSARSPYSLIRRFTDTPEVATLHDNFQFAVGKYGNQPFLGSRVRPDGSVGHYEWISYKEAAGMRSAIGSGMLYHGIHRYATVGLYCINRPEWLLVEQACYAYGFVSVPLYDTLGPDSAKYILNHAEVSVVFCTRDKLQIMVDLIADCPALKLIVILGGGDDTLPFVPGGSSCSVIHYSKLEGLGKSRIHPFAPLGPDELCSICYTSGTTGTPKGAMLSQGAMVANSAGALMGGTIMESDVYISYLPLAHIYERVNVQTCTHVGAAIGFYQGDVMKLLEDVEELKPTVFASVPRLYNRIYDRVNATVRASSGLKQYLFNTAYQAKKKALESGKPPPAIWDRLVFNKIKARLGGRARILVSGASPLSPSVMEFLRICFCATVVEGYGMTETCCAISVTETADLTLGHVGTPIPSCEVKLVDVPEMNYCAQDKPTPRGEICVRGPIIFKGYFKDEAQSKEVIDSEGWLHTGDIGTWLPGGRLKIIDRKKNIFKLAQGEYVAPEKIENVYQRSSFVAQSFVYGDSLNANLVAVVVPDFEVLQPWAKANGFKEADDPSSLCRNPEINEAILNDMTKIGVDAQLRGFEYVKAIHLTPEAFTLENGLLTPTFKIKRPQARAYFQSEIDAMYKELNKNQDSSQPLGGEKIASAL